MKTTLDLPNELVREMKLRAAHEGRKIKDVVASLLVSGLAAESAKRKATPARKGTLKLPLFKCAKNAPARRMSVEQLLALEQATQTQEDLERLGLSL
jgi:plasmid stability protein